uniref:ADF-H domain-containing protein n=1 Tax=Ursus americanus TaxID=9643 RepID=A0A452S0S9_URSAM
MSAPSWRASPAAEVINDKKVRQSSTQEEIKKKKTVLFCLTKQNLVGDTNDTVENPHASFVKLLSLNDCQFASYDTTFTTRAGKEDLVFKFWGPESAPSQREVIYASSKDAIKKKFTGIKHKWQVNGMDNIKDYSSLGEKLRGNTVVSLEGKPL